jgi:arginine decarboxylase
VEGLTPQRMFFTKGVGYHRNKLQSFELALRSAGVEKCNLVTVSSILPPHCKIISKKEGMEALQAGEITFVVMARECTDEPNRLVCAAIGLSQPRAQDKYGYLSEHHGFGQTLKKAADFAEDLAATMLGSTLGIEVDPDQTWDARKKIYKVDARHQFISRSIAQSAEGHHDGLWTTVVALAVMLMD